MSRTVTLAAAQYEPRVGDLEHNRAEAVRWAEAAADAGARLVVLPELASSGYVFASEAEAEGLAEDADTGDTIARLAEVCRRRDLHVVVGLNESAGARRYNSAVLIGAEGRVATYRKLHLFHDEQSWFQSGDKLVVADLGFARVGLMICYDIWFPEVARGLSLRGADIIAVPTNWVASFKPRVYDERGYCQGDIMAMAAAAANGSVVVCADRVGEERGVRFLGASIIVGADGWAVAGPASRDSAELLIAEIDLDDIARARQRTPRNHLLGDRRPAAYVDGDEVGRRDPAQGHEPQPAAATTG